MQVSDDEQRAARAHLPEGNHYQIVAVSNEAFRIDTQTGKVWVYDEEGFQSGFVSITLPASS
jgi:hypothetical protein